MRKYFLLIGYICLVSCASNEKKRFNYIDNDKEFWINSYKTEVFLSCINEGIKNDTLFIILSNKDLLNMNEEISFSEIDSARKLGVSIAKKIPKPYIKIDSDETELNGKRLISYNCLKYYSSHELDSIAKKAFEEYLLNK